MNAKTAQLNDAERDAADALQVALPPGDESRELFDAYTDAVSTAWMHDLERVIDSMAAHLPDIAGRVRRAFEHVLVDGRCDGSHGRCAMDG